MLSGFAEHCVYDHAAVVKYKPSGVALTINLDRLKTDGFQVFFDFIANRSQVGLAGAGEYDKIVGDITEITQVEDDNFFRLRFACDRGYAFSPLLG